MKVWKIIISVVVGIVLLNIINIFTLKSEDNVQLCNGSNIVLKGTYDNTLGRRYAGFPFRSKAIYDGYMEACINPEINSLLAAKKYFQLWMLKTWQGWADLLIYSGLCYGALEIWGKRKNENSRH